MGLSRMQGMLSAVSKYVKAPESEIRKVAKRSGKKSIVVIQEANPKLCR